jgi:nicotinic acid mononucleotide adenylyltransferase
MCHQAITTSFSADFPLQVDGIEINEPVALDTPVLLQKLEAKHPNLEFRFVCGSDLLPEIKGWGTVLVFGQLFTLEGAIGSDECWVETSMRVLQYHASRVSLL